MEEAIEAASMEEAAIEAAIEAASMEEAAIEAAIEAASMEFSCPIKDSFLCLRAQKKEVKTERRTFVKNQHALVIERFLPLS